MEICFGKLCLMLINKNNVIKNLSTDCIKFKNNMNNR